jgi:hypothetical protein
VLLSNTTDTSSQLISTEGGGNKDKNHQIAVDIILVQRLCLDTETAGLELGTNVIQT